MIDDLICDGRFDARLVRENKSAKGIFITLEIAADDYFAAKLSDVRPGALLKIGYQEIVDVSVQPLEDSRGGAAPVVITVHRPQADNAGTSKPKKRFEELPLSQQCAMRCGDARFQTYIQRRFSTDWSTNDFGISHRDVIAARVVRDYCGISSRASLDADNAAYSAGAAERWTELDVEYQRHLTDQMHAGSIRR